MIDPAARGDEWCRFEPREAQAVDEPAIAGRVERVPGTRVHDAVLGSGDRKRIG